MKKIVSLLLSAVLFVLSLPGVCVLAEDKIVVEGENYSRASVGGAWTEPDAKLSGGAALCAKVYDVDGSNIVWEYDVDVPESGRYFIEMVATKRNVVWTSDYTVYVNSEDNEAKKYQEIGAVPSASSLTNNCMFRYSLGGFSMKKGTNTIYVKMNQDDARDDGGWLIYFDCLELEKGESGDAELLDVVFSDRVIGIYEENEPVTLKLMYSDPVTEEMRYEIQLVDAWGREVMKKDLVAGSGKEPCFVLGTFATGWYRMYLRQKDDGKIVNQYRAFSVVRPQKEQITTPEGAIAMDVAATHAQDSVDNISPLAKALRKCGIHWVRERHGFDDSRVWKVYNDNKINTSVVDGGHYEIADIHSTDLKEVYELFNKRLEGKTVPQVYEVRNEEDLYTSMPDDYAAYYKTVAIAMLDAGYDTRTAMQGLAFPGDMFYFDSLMQNDILRYSSIYNFHGYDGIANKGEYARRMSNAYSPIDSIRQIWMTENGDAESIEADGVMSNETQRYVARTYVNMGTNMLSQGVDKWFWFIFRPYGEAAFGQFGMLHQTYNPYPVISALENMTHQLGDAYYKGTLDVPTGIKSYMFDDGQGNDVAVLYSDYQNYVEIKAKQVTYSDLFGYEEQKYADENGVIKLLVSKDPIFIKFPGRCDESLYFRSDYNRPKLTKNESYDTNERIVLHAVWDDQDYSDSALKQKGYIIEKDKVQHLSLRVFNFNDEQVSGKIEITPEYEDTFEIDVENLEFTLKPWSSTVIPITLTPKDHILQGSSGDIKFCGKLTDGRELSPAVSRYFFKQDNVEVKDEDITEFEGFIYGENWDLKNIDTSIISTQADEENNMLTMTIDHTAQRSIWYFPKYKVQNPEIFAQDSDGIVLRRKNSFDYKGADRTTIFVYMKDGREYFSGHGTGVDPSTEWKTLVYPWDVFVLWNSPAGFNDIRVFDPKEIEYVSIGASGTPEDAIPEKYVKNFGIYKNSSDTQNVHDGSIVFSGVENEGTYKRTPGLQLIAELPDTELSDIRVINYTTPYENYTIKDNKIIIDLEKAERGKYNFFISAKNKTDFRYSKSISFCLE